MFPSPALRDKSHTDDHQAKSKARFNPLGVQQVSDTLHRQLFRLPADDPPQDLVDLSKDHLQRHELLGRNQGTSPPIAFDLPPLQGQSLDEHFHRLGRAVSEPYHDQALHFSRCDLPRPPKKWARRSGWTRYTADGKQEAVPAPLEPVLTFDTEVMWRESSFAVMACAASTTAWYAWLSPWLLGETKNDRHLIPLGDPRQPRLIVGHNIGYDRARVKEEYDIQQSKNFFMDTMSLHVAVNGMCSQQRPTWMRHQKNSDNREKFANETQSIEIARLLENRQLSEEEEELWVSRSSVNSLRDVAKFHCNVTIDKARRDEFGDLDREGVCGKIDELLDYCAADVAITHRVYRKVFPIFLEVCPHPVSLAALRHLSSSILPINESWTQYLQAAEATYQRLSDAVEQRLQDLAKGALEIKDSPVKFENDPWLRQLDWSGQEVRMIKAKRKGDPDRPAARQKKPGMPRWFKDLFSSNNSSISLTVRTRIAPLLLRLSWDGHPLVWSHKYGWTFKVPAGKSEAYLSKNMTKCDMSDEPDARLRDDMSNAYFKLPHKDGPSARCSNPLAKGYLQYFESGTLSSEYSYAREALDMNASCSYWISARDRICSQMDVYEEDVCSSTDSLAKPDGLGSKGFILPQIIPMGTITRRAVENTWLTASNAKANRVGSELKSIIKAPSGYCFVGADVDSQELWIASLVGDAQFKLHGGNAIGFMTLEGTKAAGTDLHSKTAKILGISRNDAKVFNYGRIYGAGVKFASTLLRQFNPSLSEKETYETAARLYQETKGTKTLRKVLRDRSFWRGGSESFVFNRLEDFAEQEHPRTPALGAGITEALMRRFISRGAFMTSRINWAIQSSGVDYLHLLIVSMDYLIGRFNISARLSLTVHDEIRYLSKDSDKYRCALALQIANIWTRSMFAQEMGIHDLPQSCAFFSAVDIDHVLRKEVDMDCVTPSHPSAISPGESLTIQQLLAKGQAAFLDPTISPSSPVDTAKYAYTPRSSVMEAIKQRNKSFYIEAQISNDSKELTEILKPLSRKQSIAEQSRPDSKHPSRPRLRTKATAQQSRNGQKDVQLTQDLWSTPNDTQAHVRNPWLTNLTPENVLTESRS